jgi:membrane-associated protease RseP (regulator of RpoE activity)
MSLHQLHPISRRVQVGTPMEIAPIIYIGECIGAVALHELAHLLAAWWNGIRIKRIGICWKGPFIVREPGLPLANFCVALSGPVLNLLLAMLCWYSVRQFAVINLVLGVSNLLPFVPGADGEHAMAALQKLKTRRKHALKADLKSAVL